VGTDCKTCQHAEVLYCRTKDGRFTAAYAPTGYVRCSGPRYKGRAYFCKDSRKACGEYEKRVREPGEKPVLDAPAEE